MGMQAGFNYRIGGSIQGYVQPSIYQERIRGYDVETYGDYNTYPQEVDYAVNRSSIAMACVQTFAEFIFGEGFASQLTADSIVNDQGETMNDVLWQACKDYAKYRGFCLLLNANVLGEYTSIQSYPFTYVRLALQNEWGQYDRVKCWDNWANESPNRNNSLSNIETKYLFNPHELKAQIEECGGIANFKGQIYYFSEGTTYNRYPKCSFHAAMEEVLVSGNLSEFTNNYIRNGFSASAILVNPTIGSPEDSQRNAEQIRQMGGIREAGAIQYWEGSPLELVNLKDAQSLDKEYTVIDERNDAKIIRAFQLPNILLGSARQGGFPNQEEMSEATKYYNAKTSMNRKAVGKVFENIASHFAYPLGYDFKIQPTVYV